MSNQNIYLMNAKNDCDIEKKQKIIDECLEKQEVECGINTQKVLDRERNTINMDSSKIYILRLV